MGKQSVQGAAQAGAYGRVNKKRLDAIIAAGKGPKADSHFDTFTRLFFEGASEEYISSRSPERLHEAASDIWHLIQTKKPGQKQTVKVMNPAWEPDRTVLIVHTDDMPFLIDSISAELSVAGYRIYQIIHPIIGVERDKSGKIANVLSPQSKTEKLESVILFQVNFIARPEDRKALEKRILYILEAVGYAVRDWRSMLAKVQETLKELGHANGSFARSDRDELVAFFKWVADNHFTFLGSCDYEITKTGQLEPMDKSALGIFNLYYPEDNAKGVVSLTQSIQPLEPQELISFSKSNRKSIIHRTVHMDYIAVKRFDTSGKVIGERRFLGLYTSSVYYQSATLIPILRKKMDYVLSKAGFKPTSHDGKELVSILESYPRDEVFQIDQEELFQICMGIVEISKRPRVRIFLRRDRFDRFASCIIFVPRERFNTQVREKIQEILERGFDGKVIDHYTQVSDHPMARVHVIIKTNAAPQVSLGEIEKQILEVTNNWTDGLRETIINNLGEKDGEQLFRDFAEAFTPSYTSRYHFGGTYKDIMKIKEALAKNTMATDLYKLEGSPEGYYQLKIFHPVTQVTLSNILPILENMGFHVIDELTFLVRPAGQKEVWIHHLRLRIDVSMSAAAKENELAYIKSIKPEFEEALFKVWHKEMEDDALNMLILKAGMRWRQVLMLRACCRYIHQTSFSYRYDFIAEALAAHPILSSKLFDLFRLRFSTEVKEPERERQVADLIPSIDKSLTTVTNVAEDRVIRQVMETIQAILRTNYFQRLPGNTPKPYISFKFDSQAVPDLPLPRPYREIFVYAHGVEGIHLRGGKVARGGLRWSDRREDFRTEILGLMKAQMVKNAVIVPVGSKGGFVVKYPVKGTRDEVLAQGIECYKTFLRGLLDLTDNIMGGKVIPPKNVIRYDGDDPYLVVAADKGTATFSDIANGVSAEYGFWLDDAFASGGSAGYDHKKMGITAKGAWVGVERHFRELGKNIQKEPFTVAGVGDMSGDVFGNGMLLSEHIQLVAAFNHLHIFIDPAPDAKSSFKERKRLFDLPRSSWTDYNQKLISEGGGIYERASKFIKISKQAQKALGAEKETYTPEELIRVILRAPVELLWNGGIGTYVKSSAEGNENVGDKTNDALRVNGNEVRAKVVGEGGNLGFTQLGRIEYALKGGKLNTDAIDNSAGVDCSDHEVNIKIALRRAVESKKLPLTKRNQLLASMTDEVGQLVLRDNYLQTQAISLARLQGSDQLEAQLRLMKTLVERAGLNRKIEFLPSDETMAQRIASKQGLTRPELAILLSYSKIAVYENLIKSNLPDEDYFSNDLLLYFPAAMREKFRKEIEKHELRREIITTVVANSIVNRVGLTFFFRIMEDTGVKGCDVARAYTVARDAFNLRPIWRAIEALDGKVPAEVQADLFNETKHLIERVTFWFLRHSPHPIKVAELVEEFAPGIVEVSSYLDRIMSPGLKEVGDSKYEQYTSRGVPADLARQVARLGALTAACDIVQVAKRSKKKLPIRIVGEVYYALGTRIGFEWLRKSAYRLQAASYWEKLSVKTMIEELYDIQLAISVDVIKSACTNDVCSDAIHTWEMNNAKPLSQYDAFFQDLHKHEVLTGAMLTVAIKRAQFLSEK
jgi:glutamate dehydrogenase